MYNQSKTALPSEVPPVSHRPLPPLPVDPEDDDASLLAAVLSHWGTCLLEGEGREAILRGAGVTLELAVRLGLGCSDRSLGRRIPHRRTKAGERLRSRLDTLGILKPSGHEAFRGCLVVPVTDGTGTVVGIFGMRTDRHFVGPKGHVWAPGLPGALFGSLPGDGAALVVATVADALAVMGAGHEGVVAPGRERGFSAAELKALATSGHELVALGRGCGPVAQAIIERGGSVTCAAPDADLARTLPLAPDRARALAALLGDRHDRDARSDDHERCVPVALPGSGPPTPPATSPETERGPLVTASTERDEVFVHKGTRSWRIRGAGSRANAEGDLLRVALMVTDGDTGRFHLDTLDLYAARARAGFLEVATAELKAPRDRLALELAEVLAAAEAARDAAAGATAPVSELSAAERDEAVAWLTAPGLLVRLGDDLGALGVVGEETNLLVSYLSVTSRLCERPFGVLVQSSSAAGKSTLADAVTALLPQDQLVSLSALTAQALYYCAAGDLAHKVLAVAEDHGAARAGYALKLLVSDGHLSIAATGKDRRTGTLETRSYETKGPVALMMTTTATDLDPELENRLVVLGVDEGPAQTEAVLCAQRRAASVAGFSDRVRTEAVRRRHRAVQRLLSPFPVVLPDEADLSFPATATRHRRDHQKLLSIVTALTVLHQHQREHVTTQVEGNDVTYLLATADDVEAGVALARAVLARGPEHLAPHTGRLLEAVQALTATRAAERGCAPTEVTVTRRELRGMLGWSEVQVRRATERLCALEYLASLGGGRGRCRTYTYVAGPQDAGDGWSAVGHRERPTHDPLAPGTTGQFVRFVGLDDRREEDGGLDGNVGGEPVPAQANGQRAREGVRP